MKLTLGWRPFNTREDNPSILGPPALVSSGIYLIWFFDTFLLDGFPWVLVVPAITPQPLSVSCLGG